MNAHCRFGLSDARVDELCERFTFDYMRSHEEQFEPRSVRWVAKDAEAADGKNFHFIRAGRIGDGDACFASDERRSALMNMVRRTFPEGTPTYVAKLLPREWVQEAGNDARLCPFLLFVRLISSRAPFCFDGTGRDRQRSEAPPRRRARNRVAY